MVNVTPAGNPDPNAPKILVADTPLAIPLHQKILAPQYRVLAVTEFAAAQSEVSEAVDLVICGVHFDESRMFDFFSTVRHIPKPFVCFRGIDTPMAPAALRVIKLAGEVLGSAGFIDFVQLREEFGAERAVHKALECIDQALKGKTVECD